MYKVALVVQDGVEPFGLGSMCEVWGEGYHPEDDNPVFDFVIVTPNPGRVRGSTGFDIVVDNGLAAARDADLICVIPTSDYRSTSSEVVDLLREADSEGRQILAHCTATFILGEAGLLDQRRCTTHWRHADRLQDLYPTAKVDKDVLYVQDGNLTTGAGAAAGIDAALHLMREHFGAKVAADTARRMVVPPHRDGGQAQFIARVVPECQSEVLRPLLTWVLDHLDESHSVDALAARAHMSPRTFARRFRDEMGTSPHSWLIRQRVAAAEELLERSDESIERIAARVGFGTAAALRHHFGRVRGVSPLDYRRQFAC